jgi:uncharacterized SAM-binding protein YcdF (DUF218 family)
MHNEQVDAINMICTFLALHEIDAAGEVLPIPRGPFDLVILCGNAVLPTSEGVFGMVSEGVAPKILISGGIGHSTPFLWDTVACHPRYRAVSVRGRPEAAILADIGQQFWGLSQDQLVIEDRSTNCGENAVLSRRLLDSLDILPRNVLVVQDPLMQRRSDACFRHAYRDHPKVTFHNWPVFVPKMCKGANGPQLDGPALSSWPLQRFLSVLLGEIPRLRDDADGYGPNGRGFIVHVDIPPDVEDAYRSVRSLLDVAGERSRPPFDRDP